MCSHWFWFWTINFKDSLINFIQGCKYFSQLNCKSGFLKIRLDEDSKPWTMFSCPYRLYEWNVTPFRLKKCSTNISTNDG